MSPKSGEIEGVEVKTSLFGVFKLNIDQVTFDAIAATKGAITTVGEIRSVGYVGVNFGGNIDAFFSSRRLDSVLKSAGIETRSINEVFHGNIEKRGK